MRSGCAQVRDHVALLHNSRARTFPCSSSRRKDIDCQNMYCGKGPLLEQLPPSEANQSIGEQAPYRLGLVAAHYNGTVLDYVDQELGAIMNRLAELEMGASCPEAGQGIVDLQKRISSLRSSLGVARADTPLPRNPSRPYWNRLQSRPKSDSEKQRVCQKFMQICEMRLSEEVRLCLRMPTFDNWQWEDEEVLLLLQHLYIDLELPQKLGIDLVVLRRFLCQVYMNYHEVPFHNFHHCFCVTQMMYGIICAVDLPSKIGDVETLVLLTSCICHDLDHPGFNNIYQINARTELALRYNDISPLENHHCSVAFRILEDPSANIFRNFTPETFRKVREGMIRCILATDMARHNEILGQFHDIIPVFDYSNRAHVNQLCMVLIKVADISNEARPMDVAEPWLDCLLQEFFQQSDTEKLLGLPVTPFMDRDKITKPSSQCSFIGFVLLPLFEAIGQLIPELEELIVRPVREALEYYRRLNEASKDTRQRRSIESNNAQPTSQETHSNTKTNVSTSTSTEAPLLPPPMNPEPSSEEGTDTDSTDEELHLKEALGLDPDSITEAEVSEQTLKFKIHSEPWPVSLNHGHRRHSLLPRTRRTSKDVTCHNSQLASNSIHESNAPPVKAESPPPSEPSNVRKDLVMTTDIVTNCASDIPFFKRIKNFKERFAVGGGRRTRVASSVLNPSSTDHHSITNKRVFPNIPRFFRRSFSRTDKNSSPALSSTLSTPTHNQGCSRKLSGSLDTLLEPTRR